MNPATPVGLSVAGFFSSSPGLGSGHEPGGQELVLWQNSTFHSETKPEHDAEATRGAGVVQSPIFSMVSMTLLAWVVSGLPGSMATNCRRYCSDLA